MRTSARGRAERPLSVRQGTFVRTHGNGRDAPKAGTFPSFEPPCALRLALPRRGLRRAQHDHLVRTARDALEQTELCRTMRSRSNRAPLMMAGATPPASNEEADRLIFKRVEDIFARYPIATS